jgi:hypothetical protein
VLSEEFAARGFFRELESNTPIQKPCGSEPRGAEILSEQLSREGVQLERQEEASRRKKKIS